ncbi:MAG: DUF4011 domain-containing protein [Planctomycetota bacterium]
MEKLVRQLDAFRQRLLNLDTRNQSLFLRKIVRKRAFDLLKQDGEVPAEPRGKKLWESLLHGSGRVLLVADSDDSPQAEDARAGLKDLNRFATALFDEKGLQETYVGLCWVEGFLDEHTFVRGPLVLVPCTLEQARTGRLQGWYLIFDEEQPPEINTALAAAIEKLRGTVLPAEVHEQLADVFQSLAQVGAKTGLAVHEALCAFATSLGLPFDPAPFDGAAIEPLHRKDVESRERSRPKLRSHAVLGIFPQASSALFADFEEMIARAEKGELDQGIVDNLVGAAADHDPPPGAVDLDRVPDERINSVLPSDPSQDAVIV